MIHILFGASAAGSLKYVLRETGFDKKEKVISFEDTFSIGPIRQLHKEKGKEARFDWMKQLILNEEEFIDYTQSFDRAIGQIANIPAGAHITIWTSNNAHEQTGLRFAAFLLKGRNMKIGHINTTVEYGERLLVSKDKYAPLHTGEISPEKLQIIYQQNRGKLFTGLDRAELEKEWLTLAEGQDTLRIWRDGRIQSVPENYYDEMIVKNAAKLQGKKRASAFMKSARLIGEVLGHSDEYIGDAFFEYRLRRLIESGVFEAEGNFEAMQFYNVRLKMY